MKKIMPAMITGSLLGATAYMVAISNMHPKDRERMVKKNRRAMTNMKDTIK